MTAKQLGMADDVARFWNRVPDRPASGCWPWSGPLSHGYGRVRFNGRAQGAHRVAYELLVGPVPAGLVLDHTCHTFAESCVPTAECPHRRCVNPAHLEPVTRAENVARGIPTPGGGGAGQRKKTHCKSGHPYDLVNTYWMPSGGRDCRKCRYGAISRRNAKRREQRLALAGTSPPRTT